MVDRYLLPVPKTKNSRMNVRFPLARKRFAGGMLSLSFLMLCFQFNRYISMKIVRIYFFTFLLFLLFYFFTFSVEVNLLVIILIGVEKTHQKKLDIFQLDFKRFKR